MFDNQFLQNMAFMGNYDTLRLQHELREKEAEIERLKAKLKEKLEEHDSETYRVHALYDVMGFLQRAIDRGTLEGNEIIVIRDGDDYKQVCGKCRIATIHEITQGGKNPIKRLNGYSGRDINKDDYLNNVIVFE